MGLGWFWYRYYTFFGVYYILYEYDPAKTAANAEKHGIDFEEAKAIWDDGRNLTIPSSQETTELRALVIGRIGDHIWTAIITIRLGRIRIISVRRARQKELEAYDQQD